MVDLGSGIGKPCISFALVLGDYLVKCTGLELLENLHAESLKLKAKYDEEPRPCVVEYTRTDFLENWQTWADKELIFANATAFTPEMLESVGKIWTQYGKPGSVFILTSNELVVEQEPVLVMELPMSWGATKVRAYVHA